MTHRRFRAKLEAIVFGFCTPGAFVTTGVRDDLDALLAVRGLPALLSRPLIGTRPPTAAGPFSVVIVPIAGLALLRSASRV